MEPAKDVEIISEQSSSIATNKNNRRLRRLDKRSIALIIVIVLAIFSIIGGIAIWSWVVDYDFYSDGGGSGSDDGQTAVNAGQVSSLISSKDYSSNYYNGQNPPPWQIYNGKWKMISQDRMDEYLYEIGIGPWFVCKIAAAVTLYYKIEVNGNHIKMQVQTTLKDEPPYQYYMDGKEVVNHVNGRDYRTRSTWLNDGSKWIVHMDEVEGNVKSQVTTRQIINGQLDQVVVIGDIAARQVFVRDD